MCSAGTKCIFVMFARQLEVVPQNNRSVEPALVRGTQNNAPVPRRCASSDQTELQLQLLDHLRQWVDETVVQDIRINQVLELCSGQIPAFVKTMHCHWVR